MSECVAIVAEGFIKLEDKGKAACCIILTALITTLVCISVAIEGIEPWEFGLVKDNVSQMVTSDVYEEGLNWVGITKSLIRYPKIIQAIEFSENNATRKAPRLNTRTKEGLEIKVTCAFQYRLIREDLKKIYGYFEQDYEAKYVRIARATLLSGVSEWNSIDFWLRREEVGNTLLKKLRIQFNKVGAKVVHFNLMKIDLPQAYDSAIIAT